MLKCRDGKTSLCKPKPFTKKARNITKAKVEKLQTKEKQLQRKQAAEVLQRKWSTLGLHEFSEEKKNQQSRDQGTKVRGVKCSVSSEIIRNVNLENPHNHLQEVRRKKEKQKEKKQKTEQRREESRKLDSNVRKESQPAKKELRESVLRKNEIRQISVQKESINKEARKKSTNIKFLEKSARRKQQKSNEKEKEKPKLSLKMQLSTNLDQNIMSSSNRPRYKRGSNARIDSALPESSYQMLSWFREEKEDTNAVVEEFNHLQSRNNLNNPSNLSSVLTRTMDQTNNIMGSIARLARLGGGMLWFENRDIPVHRFCLSEESSNSLTSKKSCAVCLTDFRNGDQVKTVRCDHCYHKECIDQWLQQNATCPVCRTVLY